MNSFLIALVILELGIDIFWSIKYYQLKQENRRLLVFNKLLQNNNEVKK